MQHHDKTQSHGLTPATPGVLARPRLWLNLKAIMVVLVVFTLACTFLSPNVPATSRRIVMLTRLPTFTPTPLPPLATPEPAFSPAQAAMVAGATASPAANLPPESTVVAPPPTSLPTLPLADAPPPVNIPNAAPAPTASVGGDAQAAIPPDPASATAALPPATSVTAIPDIESAGWSFTGVQVYTGQVEDGLLLYGDVINNTGTVQELDYIVGTFYDAQGQVIAGTENIDAYWPLDFVPPGGQIPFEMTVYGIQSTAHFDLSVEAEPSSETPHQDFEFLEANQWNEAGKFCVTGQLRNLGSALQNYLIIATILYDSQDNIVNFSHQQEPSFEHVTGDQLLDIQVCIGSSNQGIARYALRAWGQ